MTALRLGIDPLAAGERGQGCHLTPLRVREIEDECFRLIRDGATQAQIVALLGASRSRVARWCAAAFAREGNTLDRRRFKTHGKTLPQLLFLGLEFGRVEECWRWTRCRNPAGYGQIKVGRQTFYAHRVAYEVFIGPIPVGKQIDHTCRNPACANPHHLQVVSATENQTLASARRRHG